MTDEGVEVLLLSAGADLPWLCGYDAMGLERLTLLVLPREGDATLLVPRLEAARVVERPGVFNLMTWQDGEDPVGIATDLVGSVAKAAIGDQTWAGFLMDFTKVLPRTSFVRASQVTAPLRMVKDATEVSALRQAAWAIDRVISEVQTGIIPLAGRSESEVAADLARRIIEEGHQRVNFVIVASGPNAASPHHDAGKRIIQDGEGILFDIGGTMSDNEGVGYCSDITRCVHLGEPPQGFVEIYGVLHEAQEAGVAAARVGTPCEEVDAACRKIIGEAGYGEFFVHRTGHGIGVEAHEHPNIVVGNDLPLAVGHVFSVEPGIYIPGSWGVRLEDIVTTGEAGPDSLNCADRQLAILS